MTANTFATEDLVAAEVAAVTITSLGLDPDLGTFALPASTTISAFGATLIDDAAASNARTTLGLGNVDNTTDAGKPVSTAQQTALNLKANLASPTFTGTVTIPDGVGVNDAASFGQVTNLINGRPVKLECRAATTAALATVIYANGSSGVGATLTGASVGALGAMDGITLAVGDRLLVKNQVAGEQNGAYVVTALGSGIAVFILTRATDSDQAADLQNGASYYIVLGTTLTDTTWALSNDPATAITIGTTALAFAQVDGAGSTAAGNGLSRTGNTLAIDTAITVDKTTAQTLTNKTLTSPAITTPTGIVKGDVGLGNVDNTSDATKNAASVTLTNKTLTSPVLNTGVSGTAIDTDATMAANSDTLLPSQKAVKTALALKAPIASPTFTGTVTAADFIATSTGLVGGTVRMVTNTDFESQGGMHSTGGVLGLDYVATELSGGTASVDLRSTESATYGSFSASLANRNLGSIHIGGDSGIALRDVAEITCVATALFTTTSTPTKWEFRTNPVGSIASRELALTLGPDKSAVFAGPLSGITTLSMAGALTGATNMLNLAADTSNTQNIVTATASVVQMRAYGAPVTLRCERVDGSAGSPSVIQSGDSLGGMQMSGASAVSGTTATIYNAARMRSVATQTWTGSVGGAKLDFGITPNGGQTLTTVLTLDQDSSATFVGAVAVNSFAAGTSGQMTVGTGGAVATSASVKSSGATAGIGYATGAGGTVTQATSKATGVTLNTVCGQITMNNAALGNGVIATFTLTNSAIAATDTIVVQHVSVGTAGSYTAHVTAVAAGSCAISVRNVSGGSLSEAIVLGFAVIKSVTS